MLLVKFDADALMAKLTRSDQCRTGTGERVKQRALRRAESFDQRFEGGNRLLCRMQLVGSMLCPPVYWRDGFLGLGATNGSVAETARLWSLSQARRRRDSGE